jgi:spermidine synthase
VTDWYDEVYQDRERFGLRVTRKLYDRQSDVQRVEVLETVAMGNVLVIDGVFMTSHADEHFYHEMIAHPAMVTAPRARRVLIIGGGDGGTAKRVLAHRQVESVVMVEIDGCVVEASKEFLPELGAWDDPRLDLRIGDGIAFVKEAEVAPFDVVILDGTDPVGPGEGLFNRDFYRGVKRVLAPGGVFALNSESPFLLRPIFMEIQAALRELFATVAPYFGPAPLYSAGGWSWTYASDRADPLAIDDARAAAVEPGCRYYNRDIHRAAFALPSDIARELGELGGTVSDTVSDTDR